MKSLTKDPNAGARQRAAKEKANENAALKSVSMPLSELGSSGAAGGKKKKPVFKSTLQPQNAALAPKAMGEVDLLGARAEDWNGAVANGWASDAYDADKVTEYGDVEIGDLVKEFGETRGGGSDNR